MRIYRYLSVIIILDFILSCAQKPEIRQFSEFENQHFIVLKKANIKEYYYINGGLYFMDSLLILTNPSEDTNQIHIYDKNFNHICAAGRKGRGPGEIENPFRGTVDVKNRIIWLVDMGRKRIMKFPIDSILDNPRYLPKETVPIPSNCYVLIAYEPFSDSLFAYIPIPSNGDLISFFNLKGKSIDSLAVADFLQLNPEIQNSDLYIPQLNYIFTFHPNRNLFAIANRFCDIHSIVNAKGAIINICQGPDKVTEILDIQNPDQIKAYWGVQSDEHFIYYLYLGKLSNRFENGKPVLDCPDRIHIFNWNGDPVAELKLNMPVWNFAVDYSSKKLYAISCEDGDIVYADLPFETF